MDRVVGATVQVGLQNVLTSIQEIISVARNYEGYLAEMKSSLEMVQGFLSDVEANKDSYHSNKSVKLWLHQLEDLAFEADAVLDEVKYKLLRHQVKKNVLGFLTSGPRRILFKVKMSGEIKDVITKLKKINETARGFGLQDTIAAASQTGLTTPTERETDSFSIEPNVEGRVTDVDNIVEMLITTPQKDKIYVLPILGMGGVGKTTVAGTVFNHENIKNHFGKRIWLSVSFKFDAVLLFIMILQDLTNKAVKETSKQVVLQKIQEILMKEKDKPYLLILDDVWNEENGKWDDEFMVPLSNISNNLFNGNCIVVTTRKENVASLVKTLPTHRLSCLSEIQCWSIIKAKSFGGEDVPKEFEKIGIDIAKRCHGLPLAAKVIGGLLDGKSEEYWRSILELELFDGEDENITKILRLSYDNLPTLYLKKCFAFCSVFPQDYTIRRQEMIELWMAEGFLEVGQGDDMEMAGSKVFDRLLQYSLFQDANKDEFGDIVDCKMHDLVHDLACSITKDMNQVRYLALKPACANESNAISQIKYLRTAFVEGKLANNIFSNFRCLHVLKLTAWEIKELPSGIEKLIHLRSLDISATNVERLPDSIGKLYHLQTLFIYQAQYTIMKKLPNTITNLISLRHLHIFADTELPPSIGKLTSLRTLKHYKVRDKNGCRIRELGSLKNLGGELKIENLEMVKGKEEAELADLSGKAGILKLTLEWNESSDGVGDHIDVLDGLQPHRRLKSLEIIGYKGKTLPSWTKSMATPACNNFEIQAFNNMVEIKLSGFTQCKELPTLGHLRHLRFLILKNWPKLRSVGLSFYRIENLVVPEVVFPALERFELASMTELTEWVELNSATIVFPRLTELQIQDCKGLESIPIGLLESCISSLESLTLWKLENLENLDTLTPCLGRMSRLWHLKIEQIPKSMIILTEISCLGSLRSLEIGGFSEPMNVDQLTTILQKCPSLVYLGLWGKEPHFDILLEMDTVQHLSVHRVKLG